MNKTNLMFLMGMLCISLGVYSIWIYTDIAIPNQGTDLSRNVHDTELQTHQEPIHQTTQTSSNALFSENTAHSPTPTQSALTNTDNSRDPLLLDNDAEEPEAKRINNIEQFRRFLTELDTLKFDLESAIDFINTSEQGFQLVAQLYASPESQVQKNILFELLYNTVNEGKISVVSTLVESQNPALRREGYMLLDSKTNQDAHHEELTKLLIEATYREQDAKALAILVSTLEFEEADGIKSQYALELIIERLEQLAFHTEGIISGEAVVKLASVSQNDTTLDILNSHLEFGSSDLQFKALQGLRYFDYPNDKLMHNIQAVMENENQPQKNRAAAAKALVLFENYAAAKKP